jgi:hypothetical protein
MGIFLINYSDNIGHNEEVFLTSISERFTQLSETSYLIETSETQMNIQETISNHINHNNSFQVIPISKFSYGPMPHWLAKKILRLFLKQ